MRNKMKKILAVILLAVFLPACAGMEETTDTVTVQPADVEAVQQEKGKAKVPKEEKLEVHFIDVGQGDATLIRQGDHAMLIDAGNNDKGTAIQSYLQSQKIEKLDYVIGTHPDADHIGGLDVVLYKFSWEKVLMPDLEKDSRTYEDVIRVIKDQNKTITLPRVGDIYSLGEAEFTIVAPQEKSYGTNSNDYSIGLRLVFGNNSFLFTGDAEEDAERDMTESGQELSAEVFKAGHHGSSTANTEEFLRLVHPTAVVISCGENNSYGHPHAEVMNELRSMGADVYRTDEQGTIVASSDGETITWNCSKSESWQAGEPKGSYKEKQEIAAKKEEPEDEGTFVLNENTRKFHFPSCSSVNEMKAKNRRYTKKTREEVIEAGYESCKRCNP